MGADSEISLYIHFPFCKQKCSYCDFTSFPYRKERVNEYVKKVCKEITAQGRVFNHCTVNTIYIGGGTPSLIPENLLGTLFNVIRTSFNVRHGIEISIEANPGTFDSKSVDSWLEQGINRVSIGVQSFDDSILKQIGRIHNRQQAIDALRMIKSAGLVNYNIDLIYGLPTQSSAQWEETLTVAMELEPTHLSAYQLIIEDNTKLHYQLKDSISKTVPDESAIEEMEKTTGEIVSKAGMSQYEVSNYAVKGYECKHNIAYWQCKPYLGIGCSAHSYMNGERFFNTPSLTGYMFQNEEVKHEALTVDRSEKMFERIMLGLRMRSGVDLDRFEEDFQILPEYVWPKSYTTFSDRGYAFVENNHWKLTSSGLSVMNSLLVMLLSEMEKN